MWSFAFVNRKAEIYTYNTDLALQRIRLANWKELHGGSKKKQQLVKKMGIEFEKVRIKTTYLYAFSINGKNTTCERKIFYFSIVYKPRQNNPTLQRSFDKNQPYLSK